MSVRASGVLEEGGSVIWLGLVRRGGHEIDGCWFVTIAAESAVFFVEFGDENRTAALVGAVFFFMAGSVAGMREIEKKRAFAAHHDVGVAAFDDVVGAEAWLLQEVAAGLAYPGEGIGGAVNGEAAPDVGDHPEGVFPAKHFGAFAGLVVDGFALVGPGFEVRTVGVVDGFAVAFIVIPEAPGAVSEMERAGVDHAVGGERKRFGLVPVAQVFAREMHEGAWMLPIFEDAGDDGEKHVVQTVGRGENLRGPMRGFGAADFCGQFNFGSAEVGPRGAGVGRFGDADARAVNPGDAGESGVFGAAVGVEHPPTFHVRIPDDDWIGRAIVNGIAEEWLGRDFTGEGRRVGGLAGEGKSEAGEGKGK